MGKSGAEGAKVPEFIGHLPRQPIDSDERIRQHLARELHDQVAQGLTSMLVQLEELKGNRRARRSVDKGLAELQVEARQILGDVRRLLYDLRGTSALEEDFVLALRRSLLPRFEHRFDVKIELRVAADWPGSLRPEAALNIYRIIQEAITNAIRHGGARHIQVELRLGSRERLVVLISDDGLGVVDHAPAGLGITGMRERALLLGGDLRMQRTHQGLVVRATFPQRLAG